jgi:hypothetical protein
LNRIQKTIVSMLFIAIMTFSTGLALVHADYSQLPWANNHLVTSGTLTVYGSSTVGPIAAEEINQGGFVNYFNNLVSSGTITSTALSTGSSGVVLHQDGSGTAIPALAQATGSGDVGEMSRPPTTGEYTTAGMNNLQLYAVGVDSDAIVLSPDMTWFPTNLNTNQVASLFIDTTSTVTTNQGVNGATGTTPLYVHWNDFLTANGFAAVHPQGDATIQRAVRDPTSGTYDCFNNFFGAPNGYSLVHKTSGVADGSQEMAPYTPCQQNSDVYTIVHNGNGASDYIGFISLGYYQTYGAHGNLIGLNIAFNMASTPSGKVGSPLITYFGTSGTQGFPTGTVNPPTWGSNVTPTQANVIEAYSGIAGSQATGAYEAWRWLWEVTPGFIPASGPTLAAGVWIAYMMADGTTNAGMVSTTPGTGSSNFAQDQNYIALERDDMAGGQVLDSTLTAYNQPTTGTPVYQQTSTFPTGVVNFNDITYFVGAYINYNVHNVYNPYADMDANGVVNFNDILGFVGYYIAYYTTWNPA